MAPVRCTKHAVRFTLDSSGKVLFNHSVGSLHRDIPFQKAFDYVQYAVERRVSNPLRMVRGRPKKSVWERHATRTHLVAVR